MELRPRRGGFLRPFGAAAFILEFLAGRGPQGSPVIDPSEGAPQTDIRAEYKEALHRAYAEDMVAGEEERRIKEKKGPLTLLEAEALRRYYLERLPMKLTRMRYHSFLVYFSLLKRLGWVALTGKEEPSTIQDYYPPAPPRIYYRITPIGLAAPARQVSDPVNAVYAYPREVRSAKKRSPPKPAAPS